MKLLKKMLKEDEGFTLVELMIVVAIIGILAAIAIPQFLRYLKSSKTAEAEQTMSKIANGAKAYYTSDQRVTPSSTGSEPWHSGSSVGTNGMPVPSTEYVFPGGAGETLRTNASVPTNGAKYQPTLTGSDNTEATAAQLNLSVGDPLYFRYSYFADGTGTDASAQIVAEHDFESGGDAHTVTQNINVQSDGSVQVIPAFTEYKYE